MAQTDTQTDIQRTSRLYDRIGPVGRFDENAPDGADTQTNRQTHGYGDSMTNSAKWGRVGENHQ